MSEEVPSAPTPDPVPAPPAAPIIPPSLLERWSTREKISLERVDRIVGFIKGGVPESIAARAHGVSDRTWRSWKQKGEAAMAKLEAGEPCTEHDELYVELCWRARDAREMCIAYHIDNIQKAGRVAWQASMTYLERQLPAEFGKRERVEHTGADGKELAAPIDRTHRLEIVLTDGTPAESPAAGEDPSGLDADRSA